MLGSGAAERGPFAAAYTPDRIWVSIAAPGPAMRERGFLTAWRRGSYSSVILVVRSWHWRIHASLFRVDLPRRRAHLALRTALRGGLGADVRQGRRAHPVREVRVVPSARRSRADVLDDVRAGAAVGQGDQGKGRLARD